MKITTPTPHAGQFSTPDERGIPMLSVVAKRTYAIEGGKFELAAFLSRITHHPQKNSTRTRRMHKNIPVTTRSHTHRIARQPHSLRL